MGPENSEVIFGLIDLCKDKVQTEILGGCFKEHNVAKRANKYLTKELPFKKTIILK